MKEFFSQLGKTARIIIGSVAFVLALIVLLILSQCSWKSGGRHAPVIVNTSSLKEVLEVSKLSTFEMIYNGVADVRNEKKPENTDFYAS